MGKRGKGTVYLQRQGMDVEKCLCLMGPEGFRKIHAKTKTFPVQSGPGRELALFGILWGENMKQRTERLE